ncbi:hypothetical protein FRB94_009799 [Tulasnella sp. JGI-2019a]|nr:hypothetical protein FRB94_009799 [Tulasnella sp. JGI-2019a]
MAWAASFGLDENGRDVINVDVDECAITKDRKESSNILVRQCLKMVDRMSALRKMSFDGARAILLLMPLTKDMMSDADRKTMHHTALLQAYRLAIQDGSSSVNPIPEDIDAATKRARLFWYAHVSEAITIGLRGEDGSLPLTFDEARVASFKTSLSTSALSASPISASLTYKHTIASIHLAETCRHIHDIFATRSGAGHKETLETRLQDVWSALQSNWEEFDELRQRDADGDEARQASTDTDVFVSSSQIFIFEAFRTIQVRLASLLSSVGHGEACSSSDRYQSHKTQNQVAPGAIEALLRVARTKCASFLPHALSLIRRHVRDSTPLFKYNAGISVDKGVFCAGSFLAQTCISSRNPETQDSFQCCVKALQSMSCKWAYSEGGRLAEELAAFWNASVQLDERPSISRSSITVAASTLSGKDDEASVIPDRWLSSVSHLVPGAAPVTRNANSRHLRHGKTLSETSLPLSSNNPSRSRSISSANSAQYEYTSWACFKSASASSSVAQPPISEGVHHHPLHRHTFPTTISPNSLSISHSPSMPMPMTGSPTTYLPTPLPSHHPDASVHYPHPLATPQRTQSLPTQWYTVDVSSPEEEAALAHGVRLNAIRLDLDATHFDRHTSSSCSINYDPVICRSPSVTSTMSSSAGLRSALGLSVIYRNIHAIDDYDRNNITA